jgi:hypothetical protein
MEKGGNQNEGKLLFEEKIIEWQWGKIIKKKNRIINGRGAI